MRIGILSDLHVDLNQEKGQDVITPLCSLINDKSIEIFLIAGDISNNCNSTIETL